MLTKCPECDLQVSDKALSCPHCGYPLTGENKPRLKKNKKKRMRLPNGFGQISEIKGKNLRKPFRAMVTVSKTPEGRPICKPLKPEAYFETYNDAYAALVEYNRNPYDLNPGMTVKELYEKWYEQYSKDHDHSTNSLAMQTPWKYCSAVYNMRASDLRARHIKGCMDEGYIIQKNEKQPATTAMKYRIKTLFNLMLDYAVEYEITDKNYARTFNLPTQYRTEVKTAMKEHIAYTEEEMKKLWDNVDDLRFVDAVLIQCYTGWRPQELCLIELENVDLENWTMTGGMKTEAGTNRTVPIHTKIRPLVERKYKEAERVGSKMLFNVVTSRSVKEFDYFRFRTGLKKIVEKLELNPEHRPHDARKQFVTMAKNTDMDEYAIKYIVGHSITDLTERVYTQRDIKWLAEEIEKIK